jgi:hypothetical protein
MEREGLLWLLLSVLIAIWARRWGRRWWLWFLLAFFFSPPLIAIVLLFVGRTHEMRMARIEGR